MLDPIVANFQLRKAIAQDPRPIRATKAEIAEALGVTGRTINRHLKKEKIRLVEPAKPNARYITVDERTLPAEGLESLRRIITAREASGDADVCEGS